MRREKPPTDGSRRRIRSARKKTMQRGGGGLAIPRWRWRWRWDPSSWLQTALAACVWPNWSTKEEDLFCCVEIRFRGRGEKGFCARDVLIVAMEKVLRVWSS